MRVIIVLAITCKTAFKAFRMIKKIVITVKVINCLYGS